MAKPPKDPFNVDIPFFPISTRPPHHNIQTHRPSIIDRYLREEFGMTEDILNDTLGRFGDNGHMYQFVMRLADRCMSSHREIDRLKDINMMLNDELETAVKTAVSIFSKISKRAVNINDF